MGVGLLTSECWMMCFEQIVPVPTIGTTDQYLLLLVTKKDQLGFFSVKCLAWSLGLGLLMSVSTIPKWVISIYKGWLFSHPKKDCTFPPLYYHNIFLNFRSCWWGSSLPVSAHAWHGPPLTWADIFRSKCLHICLGGILNFLWDRSQYKNAEPYRTTPSEERRKKGLCH